MQTATLFVNQTCNQRCGFCTFRRARDEPGATSAPRIRAAVERARAEGATELVITGGEPLLLPELDEHVRHARELGFERVIVETNGMLLAYPDRARGLHGARVRVALPAADAALADVITEVPGGFALSLRGLSNAREAGLELEVSVPITAKNLEHVAAIPALVTEHARTDRGGVEDLVVRVATEGPAEHIPTFAEAARAVIALTDAARERGITVRFDGRFAIPLCFFPARRRYPELFAGGIPREGHARRGHGMKRIDACEGCAARAQCPGVPESYLAVHGARDAEPVPEKHARWAAGLGRDRRRAVEDELVNDSFFSQGLSGLERVVRVNFHCNQACGFCFVDRTLPAVDRERIEREIAKAAKDGVTILSLSGGEPTLHPHLSRFVRLAHEAGMTVQIQSNAIRCADRALTAELASAGLDKAFVSLHAARAELSDELTGAPGTFARTIEGIDALVDAGVEVTLNCVVTGSSYRELPGYARFVIDRWGKRVRVNISFVHASTPLVPRDAQTIPRLSETLPYVGRAATMLRQAAIRVQGFDGQCGMPLCLLEPEWYDTLRLGPLPEPSPPEGFVKVEACRSCALTDRCVGLRATYLALHGSSELRPRHGDV